MIPSAMLKRLEALEAVYGPAPMTHYQFVWKGEVRTDGFRWLLDALLATELGGPVPAADDVPQLFPGLLADLTQGDGRE